MTVPENADLPVLLPLLHFQNRTFLSLFANLYYYNLLIYSKSYITNFYWRGKCKHNARG